jgi:hypothetical protein
VGVFLRKGGYPHFASVLEVSTVREKAVNADIDVRPVLVSSLPPKGRACDVASAPPLGIKIIHELSTRQDSLCPFCVKEVAVLVHEQPLLRRNHQQAVCSATSAIQLYLQAESGISDFKGSVVAQFTLAFLN